MTKRLRKKLLKKYRGGSAVELTTISDGMFSCSFDFRDIERVVVKRDTVDNKNLITVKINNDLVFSFDSNFEGDYFMHNNIQTPMEELYKMEEEDERRLQEEKQRLLKNE